MEDDIISNMKQEGNQPKKKRANRKSPKSSKSKQKYKLQMRYSHQASPIKKYKARLK
jgi:hypothetical protein